jgi:hypothetical protein
MVSRRLSLSTLILLAVLVAAGCSPVPADVAETVQPVASFDQLVAALAAAGISVEDPGETLSQPFFEPPARRIRLDGEELQVFAFGSQAQAESAAATISPGGFEIGTSMVSWVATPHFYQAGDLIVLYVGDQAAIVSALEAAMGPQIAGG